MAQLVELDIATRMIKDGVVVGQHEDTILKSDFVTSAIVSMDLEAGLRRYRITEAQGAQFIVVRADKEITLYFGNSIEGHKCTFLAMNGIQLKTGLTVDTREAVSLSVFVIR